MDYNHGIYNLSLDNDRKVMAIYIFHSRMVYYEA